MIRIAFTLSLPLCALLPSQSPTSGSADEIRTSFVERAERHYAAVELELELEASANAALTAEQEAERTRLISVLRVYCERGDFGQQDFAFGARVPQFVDREGRRCAVAELMHASGEEQLVESVRVANNGAWVPELAGDPQFLAWLERSGLQLEEAARIQVPSMHGGQGGLKCDSRPYAGPADRVPPSSAPREGDPAPAAPEASRPTGSPSTPTTPAPPPPMSPLSPQTFSDNASSDASWWGWWEYNKLEYLAVRPLAIGLASRSGDDSVAEREQAFRSLLDSLRASYAPMLVRELISKDAQVRAEAVLALRRIGGAGALPALLKALGDSSLPVRNRAILALGATGAPEAFGVLLSIARTGARSDKVQAVISGDARPLAIVALAHGRSCGFDPRADAEVARLVRERTGADRDRIAVAASIYQMLAPCAELEALTLALATDASQATTVRARAIESLRTSSSDQVLARLLDLLHGDKLELRRSAALALGGLQNDLALPALMTASELEVEPVTRSFALLSIGQQGGDKARDFLIQAFRRQTGLSRPWTALALGILARKDADPVARAALRELVQRERNRDSLPAYWIASGLARDPQAVEPISAALANAADPRHRMYAATALALIGTEAAHSALLERAPAESSGLARVAIAQGIGQFGLAADSPRMLEMLRSVREPELQGLAAVAMGFHGSTLDVSGLATLAAALDTAAPARAAALNGLGILLTRSPALALSRASRQSNYTLFDMWVDELFQVTL